MLPDGFCEAEGKGSWLWSGGLRVNPKVLTVLLDISRVQSTGSYKMGSAFRELESDPNILWYSHSNFYLRISMWFYLWSSLEPLWLAQEIHSKLPIIAFAKPKAQAGTEFRRWLFCSQGMGENVLPNPRESHPEWYRPELLFELTLSSSHAA